jgi:methylmalonyl-CoA mutase
MENLFQEFAPTSKAAWLSKIEKDLKGRSLSEFNWQAADTPLSIEPFFHADDFVDFPEPILSAHNTNAWAIGEDIPVRDFKTANQEALAALAGGCQALRFLVADFPTETPLETLLAHIELSYITTYFKEDTENRSPLSFLKTWKKTVEKKGQAASILRGGISYDPFADGRHELKATHDLLIWTHENLPHFSVLSVNGEKFYGKEGGTVTELLNTLKAGELYLKKLTTNGLEAKLIHQHLSFRFQIGISYFLEIAKLRAFKLLWGNVLAAYGAEAMPPKILACTTADTQIADAHTNKIRATTQAMSAVIGGVDNLTIYATEDSAFGRRIARNVQHLLSLESYLDRVQDPAAGSYYIEKLTERLAEAVWEKMRL